MKIYASLYVQKSHWFSSQKAQSKQVKYHKSHNLKPHLLIHRQWKQSQTKDSFHKSLKPSDIGKNYDLKVDDEYETYPE